MLQTPYQTHAAGVADVETAMGLGNNLAYATLDFPSLQLTDVPCTQSRVKTNFQFSPFGQTCQTFVEKVEFRASLFTPAQQAQLRKGLKCTLSVSEGGVTYAMQLWEGGPMAGGVIYRFSLAAATFGV